MKAKILKCRFVGALLVAGLTVSLGGGALAADLTLASYIDLSIARLELSRQAWTTTRLPPTPEAAAALFADFGIDEADYLAYTSTHHEAIDAFLVEHPEARQRIDDLSAAIQRAVAE